MGIRLEYSNTNGKWGRHLEEEEAVEKEEKWEEEQKKEEGRGVKGADRERRWCDLWRTTAHVDE